MKLATATAVAASFVFAPQALGQKPAPGYPDRPVRFIVPFVAGGGTDLIGRALGQQMAVGMGQQVIIDNRGGSGGLNGAAMVAKAPPDGYTLLLTSGGPLTTIPSLVAKMPYDALRDFAPVTLVSTYASFLLTHPSLPARSVKDLIALARARPGQMTFASGGIGTTQHLSGEMLKIMAKIDILHIPYKGTGQAIIDLLGGHVSLYFGSGAVLTHVRSGKARLIAVTSPKRTAEFPDAPTVAETLPGFEALAWVGLLAPAGLPREIVARLQQEAVRALEVPEVRGALTAQHYGVVGSTPEEFADYIQRDFSLWAKVIKQAGIRAN